MMKVLEKTPFIIPQVYQKLPEQLQLEWTLHRITVSKKDWAEFVIFLQIQKEVSIILQNMALSLGASDNSKASGKGGLTCHICSKTGHFAKECPDKRKPPKAGSNTATMSRYVCCYLQISEGWQADTYNKILQLSELQGSHQCHRREWRHQVCKRVCHIYCYRSWQELRQMSTEEEEPKLLMWSTGMQRSTLEIFPWMAIHILWCYEYRGEHGIPSRILNFFLKYVQERSSWRT